MWLAIYRELRILATSVDGDLTRHGDPESLDLAGQTALHERHCECMKRMICVRTPNCCVVAGQYQRLHGLKVD